MPVFWKENWDLCFDSELAYIKANQLQCNDVMGKYTMNKRPGRIHSVMWYNMLFLLGVTMLKVLLG